MFHFCCCDSLESLQVLINKTRPNSWFGVLLFGCTVVRRERYWQILTTLTTRVFWYQVPDFLLHTGWHIITKMHADRGLRTPEQIGLFFVKLGMKVMSLEVLFKSWSSVMSTWWGWNFRLRRKLGRVHCHKLISQGRMGQFAGNYIRHKSSVESLTWWYQQTRKHPFL
jgi:hypothetical protein